VDFLLGWSLIGWIVALVMACQPHRLIAVSTPAPALPPQFPQRQQLPPAQQIPAAQSSQPQPAGTGYPQPGWYRSPDGVGMQYWAGTGWTEHRAP
jgi:hypothetical protein